VSLAEELCAHAARLVVEEGLDYGAAKQKAARQLGLGRRQALPDNLELEDAVRDYLELFCADTQPAELAALRDVALRWMERLAVFRPLLVGAVWRGTATRHSAVRLRLFCEDTKAAELLLLDRGVDFDVGQEAGPQGRPVDVLVLAEACPALGEPALLHLAIYDLDDVRGQLKPDARGQTQAGDAAALRRLMAANNP
jgi:hypothetical protein